MTPEELKERFPVGSRWERDRGLICRVLAHTKKRIVTSDEDDDWSSAWGAEEIYHWTRIYAPEPTAYSVERPDGRPGAEVLVSDLPTRAPDDGLRERADMRR